MNSDLDRFIEAQKIHYDIAYEEIRNGRKVNHWMWFIFPQIIGLGSTATSIKYSVKSILEAKEYLENEYLRDNLINICRELLKLDVNNSVLIFGRIDSMKLKSSMTLFYYTVNYFGMEIDNVFLKVLDKYYGGEKDAFTLDIILQMNGKFLKKQLDF